MNGKSKDILEKAGWYEGRKIDLTDILEVYNKYNVEVFPKAKEFLEQFGDLEIDYSFCPNHSFNVKKLFKNSYREGWASEISIVLDEKVLRIGGCGDYCVYISESGKIYSDYGLIGNDMFDFWDLILETIPLKEVLERMSTWEELGLVEQLYDAEQKLLAEDSEGDKGIEIVNYFSGLS